MELFLDAAEKLKLKLPEGPHKFLGFKELKNIIGKNGLESISAERFIFIPFKFPIITGFSEKIENYIPNLCIFQAMICKKI